MTPADIFKINIFQKFFQKYHQCVKQFWSRSGVMICQAWSGSKMFAKVNSRRQNMSLILSILYTWNKHFYDCRLPIFLKSTSFRNVIRVSNSLDPDLVRPDLASKWLQRLTTDNKRYHWSCLYCTPETNISMIVVCYFFQNQLYRKFFQKYHQCETVLVQIRPDNSSGLIWLQTVCKG